MSDVNQDLVKALHPFVEVQSRLMEIQIEQQLKPLEAQITALKHQVNALQRLVTIPAPDDPGYEEALAKVLPYWEHLDAEERAAGNPPTWTPRRRAEASLREMRDVGKRHLERS